MPKKYYRAKWGYIVMKKVYISILLLTAMLFSYIPAISSDSVILGDVTQDGLIGSLDALLVLQYITEYKTFTDIQKALADVNRDGQVTVMDSIEILKFSTGKIEAFKDADKTLLYEAISLANSKVEEDYTPSSWSQLQQALALALSVDENILSSQPDIDSAADALFDSIAALTDKWQSIPIQGGGYVTGLLAHPNEENLYYARTDVGGAYRWEEQNQRWAPILDSFGSDKGSYYSVESLAIDVNDTDILYVAVGKNANQGAILKSSDRGLTWSDTDFPTSIRMAGNGWYRSGGERLKVDPNKSTVLYYGSRENGLFKNPDITKDNNWKQIPTSQVPIGTAQYTARDGCTAVGVIFVVFDKNSGVNQDGETNIIYAGVCGDTEKDGVYRSTDAGKTWSLVENSPTHPIRGEIASDGTLYVTHKTGVSKCTREGPFVSISAGLVQGEYSGLTIHPDNPDIVVVGQHNLPHSNKLYYTQNGGQSWTEIKCISGTRPPWWPNTFWFSKTAQIMFNPFNANQLWYCDWYGIWRTDDLLAPEGALFNAQNKGHEEVVVAALHSPVGGQAKLFSGLFDVRGFRHVDFENVPQNSLTNTTNNEISSFASFDKDPNIIYMTGQNDDNATKGAGYKSTDNGKTFTKFSPGAGVDHFGGKIAVSADDPDNLVWISVNKRPIYSTDGGSTWKECAGEMPSNIVQSHYSAVFMPLAADRVEPDTFYIYKPTAGFYISRDGGASFEKITGNGLPSNSTNNYGIKTVPGQRGAIWLYINNNGLYTSSDFGSSFTKVNNVVKATCLAFGKSKPDSPYPATVYLWGIIAGDTQPENSLYMSDDMGKTWIRINDEKHKFGRLTSIEGDGQVYGRIYIGTSGRGIYYGQVK